VFVVFSVGSGLGDELITHLDESYQVYVLRIVCDLETSFVNAAYTWIGLLRHRRNCKLLLFNLQYLQHCHITRYVSGSFARLKLSEAPLYCSPVTRTSLSRTEGAGVFVPPHLFSGVNRNLWACVLSLRGLRQPTSLRHLSRSQRFMTLPHRFICETRNTQTHLRGRLHVTSIRFYSLFADLPVTFILSPSTRTQRDDNATYERRFVNTYWVRGEIHKCV